MSVLERYCRLCLSKDSVVAHLFDDREDDSDLTLLEKVTSCISIKVRFGDGLPALLCQTCANRVEEMWYFRKKCEIIDISLRKLLKQNKNRLDNDWEDKIELLTQKSFQTAIPLKRKRKKNTALVPSPPTSVKEESEGNNEDSNAQPHVKVEAVLRGEEEDDWPQSPLPSPSSPRSSKEEDGKEGMSAKKTAKSTEKKRPEYACEFCGRTFPRSNHLAQHELTHTAEKPFQCSECMKSFWYKASLIGHIKQTHTGDVNYTCELCGKGFFKKTELTRHKPTHSNETPHKCPQCGMGFKITKTLKRHIRNVHTAQRSHTCHTCGKSFTQLQTLKVHLVLHSGVKPYVCSYCGKGFSQSAPLKTHIRIHTGERPYSCHACGDTFSTRSALTSHAFKHSGTLPYPCTRCASTFRLKRDLIQHEQGHDDEESRMGRTGSEQPSIPAGSTSQPIEQAAQAVQAPQPVIPHPIPASHTVGRPNPPMFHRQQQQQQQPPAMNSMAPSSASPPEQTFSNNLMQSAPSTHMAPHEQTLVSTHTQLMQTVSHLQTHPPNLQSHMHPHSQSGIQVNAMYQTQL